MSFVKDLINRRTDGAAEGEQTLLADATYRHNLKGALRDLRLLHTLVSEGYRFEDAMANEHMEAMHKAIACLENHFARVLGDGARK